MALLRIEDNGSSIKITHDGATGEQKDYIQKGSVNLSRNGNIFKLISAENVDDVKLTFAYGSGEARIPEVDTSYPVHSSAATLETALTNFIFA